MTKIKIENLTKIFGPRPEQALRMLDQGASNADIRKKTGNAVGIADVSFDVKEGELLVVMGLSGSGKSTLIRCLNRLNETTRGHIFVDGEDITGYDRDQTLTDVPDPRYSATLTKPFSIARLSRIVREQLDARGASK